VLRADGAAKALGGLATGQSTGVIRMLGDAAVGVARREEQKAGCGATGELCRDLATEGPM